MGPLSGAGVARTLAYAARSSDDWTRASALSNRANLRENGGDIVGSLRDGLATLEVVRRTGDVYGLAMICQHLGSLYSQSGRYAESVGYYRESAEALAELHAYEESAQSVAFISAALIGCGRIDEGRRELATIYGADGGSTWPGSDSVTSAEGGQRLASWSAALAEAELAEGNIDAGLAKYRQTLVVAGWPGAGIGPGPYETMLASAVVCAHVVHGKHDLIAQTVTELRAQASTRLHDFHDVPQTGGVGVAVGGYLIASGDDSELGLHLLALGIRCRARQDYPSTLLRTASVPRRAAWAELIATF